jgi:hypothetical protein
MLFVAICWLHQPNRCLEFGVLLLQGVDRWSVVCGLSVRPLLQAMSQRKPECSARKPSTHLLTFEVTIIMAGASAPLGDAKVRKYAAMASHVWSRSFRSTTPGAVI